MSIAIVVLSLVGLTTTTRVPIVSIDNGAYNRTVSYRGQQVLRCNATVVDRSELAHLVLELDIMSSSASYLDIRVKTEAEKQTVLASFGKTSCKIFIEDMEMAMQEFEADLLQSRRKPNNEWFEAYHTYPEIIKWYEDIASEFPTLTKLVPSIGLSTEGRVMPALHIKGLDNPRAKKKVWFQCLIHAREWISGATCMYMVDHFCRNYDSDPEVKRVLDSVELIVVPFVNPDGYAFTWESERLWRKNRNPNAGSTCVGTDLNRNFNEHWGEGGSSTNPCSDTFMGSASASEAETRNIAEYFRLNKPIYGAIDWHSYSQLILRPYGWTRESPPDLIELKEIGDIMADLAERSAGKVYVSQPALSLYETTGTARDWFYGEDNNEGSGSVRSYGYTLELRDTGRFGFELPAEEIIPQGEEMIDAALRFMSFTTTTILKYP